MTDRGRRTLLNQACDDAFDERDFGVFETLETSAVEFEAQDVCFAFEASLDHFQNTRFAGALTAVDANGHWSIRPVTKELDDRGGDRLVIEEVGLGFIVQ